MFQKHWEEVHCGTFPGDLRYKNAVETLLLQIRGGGEGGGGVGVNSLPYINDI